MADVAFAATISATNNYLLRGSPERGFPGTLIAELESASFNGSITVKGRGKGASTTWKAIPYFAYHLNGSASGATSTAAITGTSLIMIPCTGLEVSLDATVTSGSMGVTLAAVTGAAA